MNIKSIYILGISCFYHDSSACLLKDGLVIAAAAEERFTRIKHDQSFPTFAIEYCLMTGKIDVDQLSAICYYEKPFRKFERVLFQHLTYLPSIKTFKSFLNNWLSDLSHLSKDAREKTVIIKHPIFRPSFKVLQGRFGKIYVRSIIKNVLKYDKEIYFCPHHYSHAASSFFTSPFEQSAILNIDGVGEWISTSFGFGKGNQIRLDSGIRYPHSLGLFYSTITSYLGFSVNNSEYKVMGLSSYGNKDVKTNIYYNKLLKTIKINDDGSFKLDLKYFSFHKSEKMASPKLFRLLDGLPRLPGDPITQRVMDIAAALQLLTEEIVFKIINYLATVTKSKNLCFSGGVALNSVLNGKIKDRSPFANIHIHLAAGDGGGSLGAASYCHHQILNHKRTPSQSLSYLGPNYSDEQLQFYLNAMGIKYTKIDDRSQLMENVSGLIADNKVVGWFQGRMEWGPRALGNRSILANACNPRMQDILNRKVKHREDFRPFAPAVCEEDVQKYFEISDPIPDATKHMLMVFEIRKKWRDKLPAITHVDGSCRLQVVRRSDNHSFHDLIKSVGIKTGIPVIINTSFNIRGEPIVCTPDDAYTCMMGTGIDVLVMGRFIIRRSLNEVDRWDSRPPAGD